MMKTQWWTTKNLVVGTGQVLVEKKRDATTCNIKNDGGSSQCDIYVYMCFASEKGSNDLIKTR